MYNLVTQWKKLLTPTKIGFSKNYAESKWFPKGCDCISPLIFHFGSDNAVTNDDRWETSLLRERAYA